MPTRWVAAVGVGMVALIGVVGRAGAEEGGVDGVVARGADKVADLVVDVRGVSVDGPLDSAAVEAEIAKSLGPVRRCYASAATEGRALLGQIGLKLLVTDSGRVGSATLERSTVSDPGLRTCVKGHAMDLRLPRPGPPGHATVSYDLVFGQPAMMKVLGALGGDGTGGGTIADVLTGASLDEALGAARPGVGGAAPPVADGGAPAPGRDRDAEGPRSRVVVRTVGTIGPLDAGAVREVVTARLDAIRACHEKALPSRPALSGELGLRLVIRPAGTVSKATTEGSTLSSEAVESCVAAEAKGLSFAKTRSETKARIELAFEPVRPPTR